MRAGAIIRIDCIIMLLRSTVSSILFCVHFLLHFVFSTGVSKLDTFISAILVAMRR